MSHRHAPSFAGARPFPSTAWSDFSENSSFGELSALTLRERVNKGASTIHGVARIVIRS